VLFLFARLFLAAILGISVGAAQAQNTETIPDDAPNQAASGQAPPKKAPPKKTQPAQGTANTNPANKPTTQPAAKPAAKPATQPAAKPAAVKTAQASTQPAAKPAAKPTTQPAAKPAAVKTAQASTQPAAKPAAKPAAQPAPKPAAKPVPKPAPKPAAAPPAPPKVQLLGLRVAPKLDRFVPAENQMPGFLEAREMHGDAQGNVRMIGDAAMRRQDAVLRANVIDYNKTTNVLDAQTNARLIRDGNVITGTSVIYNAEDGTASVDQPNFWIDNGGAGVGSWADVFNKNQMSIKDVTYSGCPCPQPSWYIETEKLDLDYAANEGVARNGVLYFKDVPILASPYLTFPIKKERKSGLLLPTFGNTTNTGFDYTQPYYFNIAPNYDMTAQLRTMTKRGAQLGNELRYMGESYSGVMAGTYLPRDIQTGEDRWLYSAQYGQRFGYGFFGGYNVSGVSDDNYFKDFASIGINQATVTALPRQVGTGWANEYWNTSAQVVTFQTIRPSGSFVTPQYNKVPEYAINGGRFDFGGFDIQSQNTLTKFEMPIDQRFAYGPMGSLRWKPDGQRALSYNSIAYPIVKPGWYITPKVALSMAQYQTEWFGLENWYGYGQASNSRVLPIMSLDSGMTFERDTTFFGKAALQTLEPRAYYLRVPYRDQSQLPVYDTTMADFSFSSAFQENIFAGFDRIANANQATFALTSRWLDANSGFERLQLSVAQQFYFEDQYVTLPFQEPRTNTKSQFLIGSGAALTDTLNLSSLLQYNPYKSEFSRAQIISRWRPQRLATLALSYRYQVNPSPDALYQTQGQNQASASFQWPLTKKWYSIGRVDYSFNKLHAPSLLDSSNIIAMPKVTQGVVGLEYKGDCCWTGRVVFQRYVVSVDQTNSAVFFQLELGGLGNLGQNPMGIIGRSIPDYEPINPPVRSVSKFERYE
jgi:LPS-assembly protein